MHAGAREEVAVAAWPERHDPKTEASAVQHAMDLKLPDEAAFWAEYPTALR